MQRLARLKAHILEVIARSPVAEDPAHALNTLCWVRRLTDRPSLALELSALGHDIERAQPERRIERKNFPDYDSYKLAHAKESALMLMALLKEEGMTEELVEEVGSLVEGHEFGGTPEADILKDADSLSFFDVNLALYYRREGWQGALNRALWGYKRLSERARTMLDYLIPQSRAVRRLIYLTKRLTESPIF